MLRKQLISNIEKVEKIASASKFKRMLVHPFKYIDAIFFREVIYRNSKKEKEVISNTFFQTKMHLFLPSSTDIYLTGGKSHDSEIRLARFLINQLDIGDTFIDVGAHYGYFSLLGSKLVGDSGKIFSFEASPVTYAILQKNCNNINNITGYNLAVSDSKEHLKFYEFPNLYSEYNSLDVEQFKDEKWFSEYKPKEVEVESIMLDDFFIDKKINPKVIKIDVEGAELKVIKGFKKNLLENTPLVVIEYLSDERGNIAHVEAEKLLESLGFQSHIIDDIGNLQQVKSISSFFKEKGLDSDNVVFVNKNRGIGKF